MNVRRSTQLGAFKLSYTRETGSYDGAFLLGNNTLLIMNHTPQSREVTCRLVAPYKFNKTVVCDEGSQPINTLKRLKPTEIAMLRRVMATPAVMAQRPGSNIKNISFAAILRTAKKRGILSPIR